MHEDARGVGGSGWGLVGGVGGGGGGVLGGGGAEGVCVCVLRAL